MDAPVFDYRMARGEAIAKVESNVRRIDQHEYRVKSQSGKGEYQVISTELGWTCACPDYAYRQVKCKHIIAVELSLEIRRRIENAKRIVPLDFQSCICCGSEEVIKHGIRKNKNAEIQRYSCNSCGRWFVRNLGFERMGASSQAITSAMQLYFTGESLRNVQKFLRLQSVNVSHVTVYNWIGKYVSLMEKYLDQITPQVSDTWRADELYVKVKGNMKYLFAMMDDESRFWIAQQVSNFKENTNATQLFRRAKETAGKEPKTLITDGLRTYGMASHFEFPHTAHIKEIRLTGIVHNNKMERMNGEVRDREKVMRGLKKSDTPILKGYQLFHNFVRPHEALGGDTPADRCGIKVEGSNKWLTLIQNATKAKQTGETSR
jgi:transposase-like protein